MSKTIESRIENYEVQPNGNVRLSTLFRLFQKSAEEDLDNLGMTYDILRASGIVFILTKITLKIYKDIKVHDVISVTTRPRTCKGVSFIRDFDVFCASERAAYATSAWVLLDINERKLLRTSALEKLGTIPLDDSNFVDIQEKRIRLIPDSLLRTDVREVYYSQLDRNLHMNNTFYPDIVYDYMPDDFKKSDAGKLITVNYINEVMCGEKFDIFTKAIDNNFSILARETENSKDIFSSVIEL